MRLWRISNYSDLSGEGGRRAQGRWHEKGRPVVYLADHPALALLEVLVNLEIDPEDLPSSYQLLSVECAAAASQELSIDYLDKRAPGWRDSPELCRKTSASWFVDAITPLLRVPSIIVPDCFNFVLNPLHPDAKLLSVSSVKKVDFDPRLFLGAVPRAVGKEGA